jgi:hypothetical protein
MLSKAYVKMKKKKKAYVIDVLVHNTVVFGGGALGGDYIMRALTSPVDSPIDGFII